MTLKEEAKKKLWAEGKMNILSKAECNNIINELCDGFDKEVEEYVERMKNISDDCVTEIQELEKEFKSRICENCLHRDYIKRFREIQIYDEQNNLKIERVDVSVYVCRELNRPINNMPVKKDYGCPKFKRKDRR